MMMITMMRWILWLAVVTGNLRPVTSGNESTSATSEWQPSGDRVTNYTAYHDVTTSETDRNDGTTTDATVSIATEDIGIHIRSETSFYTPSTELTTFKDVETGDYIGKSNATDDNSSGNQTSTILAITPTTMEPLPSIAHASSKTEPTGETLEDPLTLNIKTTSYVTPTSVTGTPRGEPTKQPTPTFNLFTNLRSTAANQNLKGTPTPVPVISTTNLDSNGTKVNTTSTKITSSSPVPEDRILTTPLSLQTTQPRETHSTVFTPEFRATEAHDVSVFNSNTDESRSTLSPAVQQTAPDILAKVTKSTLTTAFTTNPVTGGTATKEFDEDGDVEVALEEDGSHQETAYERSLRTRRVINHAALWITIGFVVVLVSYITVLVIYNRTRPDWQDPQRPYSRFENEAEDFPEVNDNNMDCENQDLIQHFPPHENRRDFSQCVDPRDFPPCEGSHEYLLYEDPTCMDSDTCTDFTYRDQ